MSIATVSRVLNNADHVAPHTRELVQRAADRLSDQALGPRTAPARVTQGPVYLRCPYLLTDYFGLIVSSIAETLELHGRPVLLNAGEAAQQAEVLPTLASRPGISGAILVLPPEPSEQLVNLRARGFPFVVVDPRAPMPRDIAAVSAAHFAGARSITRTWPTWTPAHRRHRRTAQLARERRAPRRTRVCAGEHRGAPRPPTGPCVEPTAQFGYHAAGELLDLPHPPTALIGFNDKVAVGALAAAAQRGLRVPEDLSITGFDDIDLAQATRPQLTTVRQPLQEMGRLAVSLLIRLMERHRLDALHIELATELVIRDSTGPASPG